MRPVVSVVLIVTTLAATPVHAGGLILSPELSQAEPASAGEPTPIGEGVEGIDPRTGEVITPIDSGNSTTTTSEVITTVDTPPPVPAEKPGYLSRLTGVQWLGIGIAVLAVGAVAAGGGGGGDEPEVSASGSSN